MIIGKVINWGFSEVLARYVGRENDISQEITPMVSLLDKDIYNKIKTIKGTDWTKEFAEEVYNDVTRHKYFITNLAKCTQVDARPLPDSVYKEYLELFKQEIGIVKPKNIVLFGNQVSSIVLDEKIAVSQVRKKCFTQKVNGKE